ncbi:aminodeoxychorismate lyase [Vibrio sp. TRT 17S01]|uniref:aminodeoxychorismate lyase n=1 Tax=Vibrio sp. TRT 17S01 TaxID=3418505 RepID=UPI003CF6C207
MYWINGMKTENHMVKDRSFQYGDGCFTTLLTRKGEPALWPCHVNRMNACLEKLSIPLPDWQQIESWVRQAALSDDKAGIKIHISRGEGGRGYSPQGVINPTVTISTFPYPELYADYRHQGMILGVCEQRLGLNPMLAGHKHNNRLEQVLLKAEMDNQGYVDGVVLDINEHVIETTMANLFWTKNDVLFTPDLTNSGVVGVMRAQVLEFAQANHWELLIGHFSLSDIENADEVFITNSILGVVPIKNIKQKCYPIGKITKMIQENISCD